MPFSLGRDILWYSVLSGIIENSSGVWRGDLQEQYGTFEACGQAAHRGWAVRFEGKMGLVPGALFFWFVFFPRRDAYGMGGQKKMKNWT